MADIQFPLGWITPADRTQDQHDAHDRAESAMPKFAIAEAAPSGPLNVRLFDAWKAPAVVADVGFVFPRFHQLTGSCVGAGGGQALFSLIATQRLLADEPTKAFIPFWPFDYGRCRYEEGDRGQGEGAMGSSFAAAVAKDGILDASTSGLPVFQNQDGLVLTNHIEMQWSDGGSQTVTSWLNQARMHPVGTAAKMNSVEDIRNAIANGYPVTFACDRFIGHASVNNDPANPCVVGHWDSNGGHQQSIHAVWDHPNLGPLYWAQNNWPGSVYPKDPAGGPVCGCWVTEANVTNAFGYHAEVYALSHLNWFPAQPAVQATDWSTL